jgi:hypothetical protein
MTLYPFSEQDVDKVNNAFTYHPPIDGQAEKYEELRELAKGIALRIMNLCPPSRERSLALTNLEQAIMWANASIARNETKEEENK